MLRLCCFFKSHEQNVHPSTICCSLPLSLCSHPSSSQRVCHHSTQEKNNPLSPFSSSSTGTTQVEGLESNLLSSSPTTVSHQCFQSHFEQGTVGDILLSQQKRRHLSRPIRATTISRLQSFFKKLARRPPAGEEEDVSDLI